MDPKTIKTEFNSNLQTLERIDKLIKHAHLCALGMFPVGDNKVKYIQIIDRLFIEGRAKFSKGEKGQCIKFQEKIAEKQLKYGDNLNMKYIKNGSVKINLKYKTGWAEIIKITRDYEIFIMECLDKHGMLLKNEEGEDETPESWD